MTPTPETAAAGRYTLGPTALCNRCATLVRQWPEASRRAGDTEDGWRHAIAGMDHQAEPGPVLDPDVGKAIAQIAGMRKAALGLDTPAGAGDDVEAFRG